MGAQDRMSPERLLPELDELLRTVPSFGVFVNTVSGGAEWLGRFQAVCALASPHDVTPGLISSELNSGHQQLVPTALRKLTTYLVRLRHEIVLRTDEGGTVVVDQGKTFMYFDEVRKALQRAQSDLFVVDPYVNEDFVTKYFPFVGRSVKVRVLGRENMKTLRPAVQTFASQEGMSVETRSGSGFHDRFLFLDGKECLMSSASFHQGGRLTPAVLIPILDAADTLRNQYEALWGRST